MRRAAWRDRSAQARASPTCRTITPNADVPESSEERSVRHASRCRSRANSGSSARISWKCRRRASIAWCRAAKCACAASASSNAKMWKKMQAATSSAVHCTLDAETRARHAGRGPQGQRHDPLGQREACGRGGSAPVRSPVQRAPIPMTTRRQDLPRPSESALAASRARRIWSRRCKCRSRKPTGSSSAWATSSPIATTTRPQRPVFNRTVTLRDSFAKAKRGALMLPTQLQLTLPDWVARRGRRRSRLCR